MIFFLETVISGLMAGVMYALVAIGFVLIFKASGVFNYAQGVMALFAALTLVGVMEKFGVSAWVAIPVTMGVMIIVAYMVDYFILRHLVNEPPIILFMATIGLAYVLEGVGDIMWGPTSRCWISACRPEPATTCWTTTTSISRSWKLSLLWLPPFWLWCWLFSSRKPVSAGHSAPLPTTIRPPFRSAFPCVVSGVLSGQSRVSWR